MMKQVSICMPVVSVASDAILAKINALNTLDNTQASLSFWQSIKIFQEAPPLHKEAVAILNDRFDIYCLEPSKKTPYVVILYEPGQSKAYLVSMTDTLLPPTQAATVAAQNMGISVTNIHIL